MQSQHHRLDSPVGPGLVQLFLKQAHGILTVLEPSRFLLIDQQTVNVDDGRAIIDEPEVEGFGDIWVVEAARDPSLVDEHPPDRRIPLEVRQHALDSHARARLSGA